MGKSVVLKDLEHCPQGYVRTDRDSVICRAKVDAPAQLSILFSDGEIRRYTIDGRQEQRFSCDAAQMRGCFVHRDEKLLLVSDETMHREFARQTLQMKKKAQPVLQPGKPEENGQTERLEEKQQEKQEGKQEEELEERKSVLPLKGDREMEFPQRRWPPPPCWETACYGDGRWQERASRLKD